MKKCNQNVPSVSDAAKDAKEILSTKGNRLLLIEAILLSLVMIALYASVQAVFSSVLQPMWGDAYWKITLLKLFRVVFLALLSLFFVLPHFVGLFFLASYMECGDEPVLADLFCTFSSGKAYLRALSISYSIWWRLSLLIGTVALTYRIAIDVCLGEVGPSLLFAVFILLELAIGILLLFRSFYDLYFACEKGYSSRSLAKQRARKLRMCGFGGALRYGFAFLPWILLSVLTFGILFVADVLPKMLLTYFRFCRNMNDMMIQSEENKDHE